MAITFDPRINKSNELNNTGSKQESTSGDNAENISSELQALKGYLSNMRGSGGGGLKINAIQIPNGLQIQNNTEKPVPQKLQTAELNEPPPIKKRYTRLTKKVEKLYEKLLNRDLGDNDIKKTTDKIVNLTNKFIERIRNSKGYQKLSTFGKERFEEMIERVQAFQGADFQQGKNRNIRNSFFSQEVVVLMRKMGRMATDFDNGKIPSDPPLKEQMRLRAGYNLDQIGLGQTILTLPTRELLLNKEAKDKLRTVPKQLENVISSSPDYQKLPASKKEYFSELIKTLEEIQEKSFDPNLNFLGRKGVSESVTSVLQEITQFIEDNIGPLRPNGHN